MSAGAAKALTSSSHFALFGLPAVFSLDQAMLDKAYRDIQSQVHPDRFAHAGDAERRASLQWTTRVNEATQQLAERLMDSALRDTLRARRVADLPAGEGR